MTKEIGEVSFEKFLKDKQEEFDRVKSEIGLLKKLKGEITVYRGFDSATFYSKDYTLARDFEIRQRSIRLESASDPEGGYNKERIETYPQFFYNLSFGKRFEFIYIKHNGFDNDPKVVIASVTRSRAWGHYSNERGDHHNRVDVDSTIDFFRKQGVRENLLLQLLKRIKEANELNGLH